MIESIFAVRFNAWLQVSQFLLIICTSYMQELSGTGRDSRQFLRLQFPVFRLFILILCPIFYFLPVSLLNHFQFIPLSNSLFSFALIRPCFYFTDSCHKPVNLSTCSVSLRVLYQAWYSNPDPLPNQLASSSSPFFHPPESVHIY